MKSKNIGIGNVYTYRIDFTKNKGQGYVAGPDYVKTRNVGIGRFPSVDTQQDASEGLVRIDGEVRYVVPEKYASVGPVLPSIIVNVDIDAGTVTILGQIKNASETYQIYLDDVSYGVVTDSFEITLTKQDPGTYTKTVKIVGEDTGTTIEKNFTYEVEQYIPEPADMTLRFLFSQATSDPTTLGTAGTWTKVANHPDGNVWDWTYDNSDWSTVFRNKLTTSFDSDVKVIDAGDTSKVTNIRFMFDGCAALTSVALFDTGNVVYINGMFQNCTSLTSVPLFDTHNITNMRAMLYNCSSLTTVPLFDTQNATSMQNMFRGCTSLTEVPLFDTNKVTNMYGMFQECTSLIAIPQFNTSNVTSMTLMFRGCTNVESGSLTLYQRAVSTGKVDEHSSTFYNCGANTTTGLADLNLIPQDWGGRFVQAVITPTATVNEHTVTISGTISNAVEDYYLSINDEDYGTVNNQFSVTIENLEAGDYTYPIKITGVRSEYVSTASVQFTIESEIPEPVPMSLRFLFSNESTDPTTLETVGTWAKLTNHPDGNVWDWTYDNSDWSFVFGNMLTTSFDSDIRIIAAGDTSNVTNMSYMFFGCTSLTEVPLFDTKNVTNMNSMFFGCTSLTTVPLFDTKNVTNMFSMFFGCSSLTTVPLFNTSSVTDMTNLFSSCTSLTEVPLFDTSSATDMSYMFQDCSALTSVPLFDISNVIRMNFMLRNSTKVESGALALYQAAVATGKVSSHTYTFTNCGANTTTGLAELKLIPTSWGGLFVEPVLTLDTQVDGTSVTISGTITNVAEDYIIDINHEQHTVTGDSFQFTYDNLSEGDYDWEVIMIGDKSGYAYQTNVQFTIAGGIPEPAPMTLRFAFSNEATDPTTIQNGGTWTKVDNHPEGNVWDWTCTDSNWDSKFQNKLSQSFDPNIRVIETGNCDSVTRASKLFAQNSGLTSVNIKSMYNCTDMSWMFYDCSNLTEINAFDTTHVTDMHGFLGRCVSIEYIPNFLTAAVENFDSFAADCYALKALPNLRAWSCMTCNQMFDSCFNVESGITQMYNNLQYNSPAYHTDTFTNCGRDSETGYNEWRYIPTEWGGGGEELPYYYVSYFNDITTDASGNKTDNPAVSTSGVTWQMNKGFNSTNSITSVNGSLPESYIGKTYGKFQGAATNDFQMPTTGKFCWSYWGRREDTSRHWAGGFIGLRTHQDKQYLNISMGSTTSGAYTINLVPTTWQKKPSVVFDSTSYQTSVLRNQWAHFAFEIDTENNHIIVYVNGSVFLECDFTDFVRSFKAGTDSASTTKNEPVWITEFAVYDHWNSIEESGERTYPVPTVPLA